LKVKLIHYLDVLGQFFPYYLHVDNTWNILGFGSTLKKMLPQLKTQDSFRTYFRIKEPVDMEEFQNLFALGPKLIAFELIQSSLLFRGGLIADPDQTQVIFLGSPIFYSFEQLQAFNLNTSDFSSLDPTLDFLLALQSHRKALEDTAALLKRFQETTVTKTFMSNILESIHDGIVVFNPSMGINQINTSAKKLFLISDNTDSIESWILSYGIYNAEGGKIKSLQELPISRALSGEVIEDVKFFLGHGHLKSQKHVKTVFLPVRDRKRSISGALWILNDMTEQRKSQMQLIQASKLASLGEMSAGIAHELNNPLFMIKGFASRVRHFAQKENLSDPGKKKIEGYLQEIDHNCNRMQSIVEHLREFSRQADFRFSTMDLHAVIRKATGFLAEQFRVKNIRLNLFVPESPLWIQGDALRMEQVFVNLLTNARDAILDAHQESGSVDIFTQLSGDHAVITFKDNGKGIPADHLSWIFEPFFTTKEIGKGTGLGLSIAQGIVKEHQGTLECESEVDVGTTFTLKFPVSIHPS
jgi:signal transduction histidine kinase